MKIKEEVVALMLWAILAAVILGVGAARGDTFADGVATCERASDVVAVIHQTAKQYDDGEFSLYNSKVKSMFNLKKGESKIDSFVVYSWFFRHKETQELVNDFIDGCYDNLEKELLKEKQREERLWKSL